MLVLLVPDEVREMFLKLLEDQKAKGKQSRMF